MSQSLCVGVREKDKEYARQLAEMKERVRARPLLIESDKLEVERLEKRRKALLTVKESLDKAGIKNYNKFFDKEELEILDLKM